jgi:hypothetical protein
MTDLPPHTVACAENRECLFVEPKPRKVVWDRAAVRVGHV